MQIKVVLSLETDKIKNHAGIKLGTEGSWIRAPAPPGNL